MGSSNEALAAKALRNEHDYFDSVRMVAWRVSVGEMRIKWKAKGCDGWKLWKKFETCVKMEAEWTQIRVGQVDPNKGIVVRECVDNAQVLPPAGKMTPVDGLPWSPDALVQQYGKAIGGTLEIVRFGAMLCDMDDALSAAVDKAPQGRRGDESLKGWLETHCPDINYGTAMGYKTLADDLRDVCKIPDSVPLTLAVPETAGAFVPPADYKGGTAELNKLAKIQQRVLDMVDGKSARQVRVGLAEAASKPKGGAREREKLNEEQKRERLLAAAKAWWTGAVADMCDQVSCGKSHALLDQDTLNAVFLRINMVRDALKEAGAKEV